MRRILRGGCFVVVVVLLLLLLSLSLPSRGVAVVGAGGDGGVVGGTGTAGSRNSCWCMACQSGRYCV